MGEEEEPTMTFEAYEKANADKMAALNSLNKYEEVVIENDDAVVLAPKAGAEDEFALIFHDSSMDKKVFAKKEAREGYKQARVTVARVARVASKPLVTTRAPVERPTLICPTTWLSQPLELKCLKSHLLQTTHETQEPSNQNKKLYLHMFWSA